MRLFTTISLTHSDGHIVFGDDNAEPTTDHYHNWYDFWDADLGQSVGPKRTVYEGIEGLFITLEFEKGFAIYNRRWEPSMEDGAPGDGHYSAASTG